VIEKRHESPAKHGVSALSQPTAPENKTRPKPGKLPGMATKSAGENAGAVAVNGSAP
jgi:hypothetical protein